MKNEKKVPTVDPLFWKINAEQYDDSILILVTKKQSQTEFGYDKQIGFTIRTPLFYHTSSSLYTRIDFMTLLFIFIFSFKWIYFQILQMVID